MQRWLVLPLVIALAGCAASDESRKAEQRKVALPTKETLPFGLSEDCECIEKQNCPVFEMRAGYLEVTGVRCEWTDKVDEAKCDYELRFVAERTGQNGKSEFVPEEWGKETMIARHLGNGQWCAADKKA